MDDEVARYLKAVADAMLETTRIQREMQQEFAFSRNMPRQPKARTPSHRGPINPLHQTWRAFVQDMQRLEARARKEGLKLTKANVCYFGTDTVKTVTRTMEWYGLDKTDWPPSRWDPNELREGHAGAKN